MGMQSKRQLGSSQSGGLEFNWHDVWRDCSVNQLGSLLVLSAVRVVPSFRFVCLVPVRGRPCRIGCGQVCVSNLT